MNDKTKYINTNIIYFAWNFVNRKRFNKNRKTKYNIDV